MLVYLNVTQIVQFNVVAFVMVGCFTYVVDGNLSDSIDFIFISHASYSASSKQVAYVYFTVLLLLEYLDCKNR